MPAGDVIHLDVWCPNLVVIDLIKVDRKLFEIRYMKYFE